MNKSSNRHMNVFQAYTQKKERPIENNVSRGFAIVLQESPSLFMLFLQKLNEELKTKNVPEIPFPQGEYTVDFQRKADSFHEEVNTLIGVTLTANELEEPTDKSEGSLDRDFITDISVSFDDVLLFIEVKRTDENCKKQVEKQLR